MNMHCGCIIVRCDDCRDRTRSSEPKSVDGSISGEASNGNNIIIPSSHPKRAGPHPSSGEAKGKSPFAVLGLSGDERRQRGDKHASMLRRWPCSALCCCYDCSG